MSGSTAVMVLDTEDPRAVAAVEAIHTGDVARLVRLLAEHPGLATARLGEYDGRDDCGMSRTLLHVVTDWPGHYPNGAATVAALVAAGAEVNARFTGPLGLMDRLEHCFAGTDLPGPEEVSRAFWGACHGGQQRPAAYLLDRGADVNWVPDWENRTPLDAAMRSAATDLAAWLRERGASTAAELGR